MSSPRSTSGLGPGSDSRYVPANGAPEEDLENDGDPEADELEGEDLMDDNMMDDYKAIPELDTFEEEGLDLESDQIDPMDPAARAAAERQMRKRDLEEAKRMGRGPAALQTPENDEEEDEERPRQRRRIDDGADEPISDSPLQAEAEAVARLEERKRREARERVRDEQEEDEPEIVDLDEYKGPLGDFISQPRVRAEIKRRFRAFVTEYKEENSRAPIYPARINMMCTENKASLDVSYYHLSKAIPRIAIWVADAPELILEILDEEALAIALHYYPNYGEVHPLVHVRITHLPIVDSLRDLRQIHLNSLVKVEGVVTRRTAVYPQLQLVRYNCAKCGASMGPYTQNDHEPVRPGRCPECQSAGPFNLNSQQTVYRNYQKITLQESPGSVPAGRVPRTKDIILLHDLIDTISPGELVEVTGIYKHSFEMALNTQNGFPVFNTVILANYISKSAGDIDRFKLSDEDVQEIQRLAAKKNIAQLIFNSIGPSIYGHENIKIALALAMFGGEPKEFENKHRIRGDINVLVLGDPGTAKSQFLKYVEKTSNRAVYTTGKGASAVGLTASVHADPVTREWTLEGGALVLADQGICLIDEFDKMNDQDRTSIHEAMEQQSISISKAGIIATLKARCSVIAAANPISGRYDSSKSFIENVELTDAILSRFDCLCVVRDTVDNDVDRSLADFVIGSHMKSHPAATNENGTNTEADTDGVHALNKDLPQIPQALLRKYITYARTNFHPKLTNIDDDKIARLYSDLRRESLATGGIPIAVRHIESMIRMSEAHAKLHLRDHVTEEDVNMAIRVMLESFISTQKFSVMRSLHKHFKKYLHHKRDHDELLLHTLNQLVQEAIQLKWLKRKNQDTDSEEVEHTHVEIPTEEFEAKAQELNISNLDHFFKSNVFTQHGYSLNQKGKMIIKQA